MKESCRDAWGEGRPGSGADGLAGRGWRSDVLCWFLSTLSPNTCPSILPLPFTSTFPPGRVEATMRGHFANGFVLVMQIVSEKGCAAEGICFCAPFSNSLSLFNQSESQYAYVQMCAFAHFWHSFNVYWHRCMKHFWPPLWWCQIRKLGKMRGDLMKGERRNQERWMFYLHHMESLKYPRLGSPNRQSSRCYNTSADVTSVAFCWKWGVSLHVSLWVAARTYACEDSQRRFSFKASFTWLTCPVRKVIRQSWNESLITTHEIQFFSQRVFSYRTQPFFSLNLETQHYLSVSRNTQQHGARQEAPF